jgi:hypothetical protein
LTGAAFRFQTSPREVQVLALVLDGYHLDEIARQLDITSSTVKITSGACSIRLVARTAARSSPAFWAGTRSRAPSSARRSSRFHTIHTKLACCSIIALRLAGLRATGH